LPQRHAPRGAPAGDPEQLASTLRLERVASASLESCVLYSRNLGEASLSPHHRGVAAADTAALSGQAEPFRRLAQRYGIAERADDVEHHVHMVEGDACAFLRQARLLGQNVEVEAEPVPGKKRVTPRPPRRRTARSSSAPRPVTSAPPACRRSPPCQMTGSSRPDTTAAAQAIPSGR